MNKSLLKQLAQSQAAQIQQQIQQQQVQQLQERYDAWQSQQALQQRYDAWQAAQQPVQPVQNVQPEIPQILSQVKGKDNTPKSSLNGNSSLEKVRNDKLLMDEKKMDFKPTTTSNETQVGLKQLPGLADYKKAINEAKTNKTEKSVADKISEVEESLKNLDRAKALLDPTYKMSKDEVKEAKALANQELNKFKGRKLTQEEQERQRIYQQLQDKTSAFKSFAVAGGKGLERTAQNLGNLILTANQANAPTSGALDVQKKVTEDYRNKVAKTNEAQADYVKSMQTQHPVASGAGSMAEKVWEYSLTNPLFDSIGAGANAGKVGNFLINQAGQNMQDVALDTLPTYMEMISDGELTEEELKQLRNNALLNAGGNLAAYGVFNYGLPKLGEIIGDSIANRQVAKAAQETFNQNIAEGAEKLAKLNEQGYVPPQRHTAQEIAALNQNPVKANNEQFSALMNEFNGTFKDDSAMRNIFTPEDLDAAQKAQFDELMKNRPLDIKDLSPEDIPDIKQELPDIPSVNEYADMWKADKIPETDNIIPNIAEKLQKARSNFGYLDLPEDVLDKAGSDFMEIGDAVESMYRAAKATDNAAVMAKYEKMAKAVSDYETAVFKNENIDEVIKAKKAADAARQSFIREMKKIDPGYKGELTGNKLGNAAYRRTSMLADAEANQELADSIIEDEKALREINGDNRFVQDAEPETKEVFKGVNDKVEGANPLQTFADGKPKERWETSKFRTNTAENQGWGKDLPEKDYAYRVFSQAEQHEEAALRGQTYNDLIYKDSFDAPDIKAAMDETQQLLDSGDVRQANRLAKKLAFEGREHGRGVQAFVEYKKNTATGALQDAASMEEDILKPWKSRNTKRAEGNSRIARALADLGNKNAYKKDSGKVLTHDEIRNGVIAEIEREVGSVEKYFNDNDIEYLTTLAEDNSIPVWQITSEIEHKLNTGNWYSLDESIPIPKPTNTKLNNALKSLVDDTVRAEAQPKSLKQITEEVRNTLANESSSFEGTLTDDDIDFLANLIDNGATKEELADALNMKLATGSFGLKDETLREVNNIFKEISRYDENSKQFVEGQVRAYQLMAEDLLPNATAAEKFEAWRYLAMLGNPKTMLRNFIGNQTFGVVTGISNNLAAIAEAGIDKGLKAVGGNGIQRTKAVLNPIADGSLIKAAAEDADFSRYRQISGSKYEKFSKDSLRKYKSVFNTRAAQFYEKLTDAGISDYQAVKNKYATSLAGYMKANGMDESIFKVEDQLRQLQGLSEQRVLSGAERAQIDSLKADVEKLDKARDYALKQAEYATFHEDSKIADVLSQWSRTSKEKGFGIGHILIEGMVPFKKTPANVLRSGVEYSPLGAIESIAKTGKLVYENTGKRAGNLADTYLNSKGKEVTKTLAADVIDSWSKTLTGTGLTALGFYLYNKGILHSSDPDTKYQDQLEGHQNYAIEINGKSYTLDWLAPAIMPLMVGAEAAKIWGSTGKTAEDFYNNADAWVDAANKLADPLIETSMLQGVRDIIESAANYAKNDKMLNIIPMLGYNLATGYATQAVPTISGQIARTVDNTRRSTYTQNDGIMGVFEEQARKQMNKIPGLSTLNQPYLDTYGREQKNGPFNNPIGNFAYQALSPGYIQDINETKADKVSREAYNISGDKTTLPQFKGSFKIDGKKVSPENYTKAAKVYGQTQTKIRTELANSKEYQSLSDADKELFMKKANTLSEKAAMERIDPNFEASKEYQEYKTKGIKGLLKEYKSNSELTSALDEYGLSKSETTKKIYAEKGEQGLKTLADFQSYGDNATEAYKRYETTKSKIPGLTVNQYKSTVKLMDGLEDGTKNGQISQKEMLAYLNENNISEDEAQKLFKNYGNNWKGTLKKNKKGQWTVSNK